MQYYADARTPGRIIGLEFGPDRLHFAQADPPKDLPPQLT
jgi:hypothetical protein